MKSFEPQRLEFRKLFVHSPQRAETLAAAEWQGFELSFVSLPRARAAMAAKRCTGTANPDRTREKDATELLQQFPDARSPSPGRSQRSQQVFRPRRHRRID